MHIAVLGATGGTGTQFVNQAIEAGHTISALVRNPKRLAVTGNHVRIVEGDMLKAVDVRQTVSGADAVVSAIGADTLGPTTAYSESAKILVESMAAEGVRRIITVAAVGTNRNDPNIMLLGRLVMGLVLRNVLADMKRMEEILESSDLQWTVMWPPRLTDGPKTGKYRTAVDCAVKRGSRVSRADVAHAMLMSITDESTFGRRIALAE